MVEPTQIKIRKVKSFEYYIGLGVYNQEYHHTDIYKLDNTNKHTWLKAFGEQTLSFKVLFFLELYYNLTENDLLPDDLPADIYNNFMGNIEKIKSFLEKWFKFENGFAPEFKYLDFTLWESFYNQDVEPTIGANGEINISVLHGEIEIEIIMLLEDYEDSINQLFVPEELALQLKSELVHLIGFLK